MKKILAAAALTLTQAVPALSEGTSAENAPFVAMGAYIASDDLAGSEAFFRTLFAGDPVIRLEAFVAFSVAGGWFAIVDRSTYAPGSVPGTGAVPYIQSTDLEELRARYADATGGEAPDVIVEPGIRILKLEDPDGQLIEFFAFAAE